MERYKTPVAGYENQCVELLVEKLGVVTVAELFLPIKLGRKGKKSHLQAVSGVLTIEIEIEAGTEKKKIEG